MARTGLSETERAARQAAAKTEDSARIRAARAAGRDSRSIGPNCDVPDFGRSRFWEPDEDEL
jgi:hypothetical protein